MKKVWKKTLAACCAVAMLLTMPGMCVQADEIREEGFIVAEAEVPEETVESVDFPSEDVTDGAEMHMEEEPISLDEAEKVVGTDAVQVGNGVTVTFDANTGAVEFTSRDGEISLDWVEELGVDRDEIKSIKVVSGTVHLPYVSPGWYNGSYRIFGGLSKLESLDLSGFDTSNVTHMRYMFRDCSSLTNLDLSSFDTSNVSDMRFMFYGCSSLSNLDLSSFNTSNVSDMSYMFSGCSSLKSLVISSFDTTNVTRMSGMFEGCSSLTHLGLSNFNTSNVTIMDYMFLNCSNLTDLDLSGFNTSNVSDIRLMFYRCSSLISLDLSGFDTSNVTNMNGMFEGCNSLTSLDVSRFDTSNVTSMDLMFSGCSSLKSLVISSFDTKNVTRMSGMFQGCSSLTHLGLSNFNTSNVTIMDCMFQNCSNLADLDLSGFNTSNVTSMLQMFVNCSNLTSLDLSSFDTSKVTTMYQMFGACSSLINLNLSAFNTSNVIQMGGMFGGCRSLTSLDVSGFDTSSVTNMHHMFSACNSLTDLDLSNFNTLNVTDMGSMFSLCNSLTDLDLSNFNTSNVTDMGYMFYVCSSLLNLDLRSFNTSNVTNMNLMFAHCSSLTDLDLSSFNTSNVTDMSDMFLDCSLTDLDLSSFDTTNVTDMGGMFAGCSSLRSLDLSSFNTTNVTDMYDMFGGCGSIRNLDLSSFDTTNVTEKEINLTNCSSLDILRTPKINRISDIALPHIMYDKQGTAYTNLPVTSKSIVLGFTQKAAQENSKIDISTCIITLDPASYTYDGKPKKPAVTVKDSNEILMEETDYTVIYSDNQNAGNATVTLLATENGNCKGTTSFGFTIKKADAGLAFTENSLIKKMTDEAFTNTLTKITDAAVIYSSSDISIAVVDHKSGFVMIKGSGTVTITAFSEAAMNYNEGSASYTLTVEKPTPASTSGFSDVQDLSHPYYNAIYWAAEEGITKGYSDGTFGVNKSCTRGEMIMFLWRFAGKPAPKSVTKSPFKDVPTSHAFYKAVLWAYQTGVTKGYSDGTFGINRDVSRGECMMFLWRIKGKPAPTAVSTSPFKDVPKTHAFYNAILWGSQKGITKGYTSGLKKGNFGINDNCTRGQIVTFLYRAK